MPETEDIHNTLQLVKSTLQSLVCLVDDSGDSLRQTGGRAVDNHVNLIKLSVGTETVEGLAAWQKSRRALHEDGLNRHVTRMWPKRESEIVGKGSIFWVIKGVIQARQKIQRLDEVIGQDGIRRCAIVLDPKLHRTEAALRRPFQGWRYLLPADAPRDLPKTRKNEDLIPPELATALAEIGVR
jgi:hypothetical protein